jgi:hypothetical protein
MSRLFALILALFVASAAMAEELPADRPEQIGRLVAISGAVSYHATPDAPASVASVNYPLTTGNRIATPARTHATIDIAAGRFYLDGASAMTVGRLGPGTTAVTLDWGALILRILPGGAGQVFVIETPRGRVRADQTGYFEVEVAAETGMVTVSTREGGAQLNETMVLPPGTRASIAKDAAPSLDTAAEDDFIRRVAAEIAEAGENKIEAPSHVSPQITGFPEMQRHGLWVASEQYGWVWEPQVMSDWEPFRDGRWVDIAPWGRTWIDNAPWGFAPAHYGNWAKVNQRWVWVPGNAALTSVTVNGTQTQSSHGGAAWISLGPEEPVSVAAPVIVNNVRVINQPPAAKVVSVTTVNNTTNVTNVVKEDRRPSVVFIGGQVPSPPPSPPPSVTRPGSNLSGLGAAGTPFGRGVSFPGQR